MCIRDSIYRIWDEGQADRLTQLVFCDLSTPKTGAPAAKAAKSVAGNLDSPELHAVESQIDITPEPEFTVYDDIREKLAARGIPREQIAFIHEANTEARKKELFAKVRSGQVRVLMGSTFKMGAGMNVQDRLVAVSYTHLTGLMQKLTEMKKYLESDEVQLLELTEGALAKLATMTDEEFGQLELYPDFDI